MSKYIDSEKLKAEIGRRRDSALEKQKNLEKIGQETVLNEMIAAELNRILSFVASLQQEQLETDVKSPFTGGKVAILSREEEVTFRGEKVKITRKYYRCEDTGREFTDDKLDDDMMWTAFRAYCEKKGMTSFTDIMLKQEQPEVDLEKEIEEHAENMPHGEFTHDSECREHEEWAKREFRHFYSLGLNARKEE